MTSNHWCVCSTSPACQPQCKTFPLRDSPLGRILSSHTFFFLFFTTSYLLSRHFANHHLPSPRGLPTCLPTLSFAIKSENDAFRLSYEQQPPLRGFLRGGFFHCHFRSAIRLSQHLISFFFPQPLRQTDSAGNTGAASIQFQGRTIYTPFAGQAEAEGSLLWFYPPRLSDVCWGNVAAPQPRTSAAVLSPISPGVFPRGVGELNIWQQARRGVTPLTCAWF